MIVLIARKPGKFNNFFENINTRIICPESKNKIVFEKNFCVSKNPDLKEFCKYPRYEDVPVLIRDDMV